MDPGVGINVDRKHRGLPTSTITPKTSGEGRGKPDDPDVVTR
jgi:hypothetical protein